MVYFTSLPTTQTLEPLQHRTCLIARLIQLAKYRYMQLHQDPSNYRPLIATYIFGRQSVFLLEV